MRMPSSTHPTSTTWMDTTIINHYSIQTWLAVYLGILQRPDDLACQMNENENGNANRLDFLGPVCSPSVVVPMSGSRVSPHEKAEQPTNFTVAASCEQQNQWARERAIHHVRLSRVGGIAQDKKVTWGVSSTTPYVQKQALIREEAVPALQAGLKIVATSISFRRFPPNQGIKSPWTFRFIPTTWTLLRVALESSTEDEENTRDGIASASTFGLKMSEPSSTLPRSSMYPAFHRLFMLEVGSVLRLFGLSRHLKDSQRHMRIMLLKTNPG
ncbi:hypothetical protein J7T55_001992 [Diaporthe amygdali]|uniref:uncharacterized protein n=1 Tax=Phomopsis amygdali TaxID=1214568 RepID=UPI0022FF28F0|nr:uncharacterized protein J7T55_001992 [Diaporthe amygdali]KAJ0117792.1 hypothetical protein J7T55_001992 [Diaporthe amygdali]